MAVKLHLVRQACQLAPHTRTEEHIDTILAFVRDIAFFPRLQAAQQRGLCRTMTFESFARGDKVFELGEDGDKFYIILNGGVSVHVPSSGPCPLGIHTGLCACPGRQFETGIFLERGAGFGDLALESEQPRSATVHSSGKTELLVVTRADYQRFAGMEHKTFLEQRVRFLRRCPRMEDSLRNGLVAPSDLAAMAGCLVEAHLCGNAVVVRQGELAEMMVFVRSGQLLMLRTVEVDAGGEAIPQQGAAVRRSRGSTNGQEDSSIQATQVDDLVKAMADMRRRDRRQRLTQLLPEDASYFEERGVPSPFSARFGHQVLPGHSPAAGFSKGPHSRTHAPEVLGATESAANQESACQAAGPPPPARVARRTLLRVGVLGPQQYYGHQQLVAAADFPISLVSDPVAEIYTLSKNDCLRRLPRKSLMALFSPQEDTMPSDQQLLELHVQTRRWDTFCHTVRAEALASLGQSSSVSRVDPAGNLEFLGVRPEVAQSAAARTGRVALSRGAPPRGHILTLRDEVDFSDVPAQFLRRFDAIKRDPGLRNALARAGLSHWQDLQHSLRDTARSDTRALSIPLERHWAKLEKDPVDLDLDDAPGIGASSGAPHGSHGPHGLHSLRGANDHHKGSGSRLGSRDDSPKGSDQRQRGLVALAGPVNGGPTTRRQLSARGSRGGGATVASRGRTRLPQIHSAREATRRAGGGGAPPAGGGWTVTLPHRAPRMAVVV